MKEPTAESKMKSRNRRHNLMILGLAVLLVSPIAVTISDFALGTDVVSRIGIEITHGSRHLSSGVYFSNISFIFDVRVSSADPIFLINVTHPFFELTVEGYSAGFSLPQNLLPTPRSALYYTLNFTLVSDPTLTDYVMQSKANNLELSMSGLASASFYQHHILTSLSESWNWSS